MENKIYCTQCGAVSETGTLFCSSCGAQLIQEEEQADRNSGKSAGNTQPASSVFAETTSRNVTQPASMAIDETAPRNVTQPASPAISGTAEQNDIQQARQNEINAAMQTPLPPVYPAVQPVKKNAGFLKGMAIGCLIPVVLFFLIMIAGFFLFNAILSRFLTNFFPGMSG